MTDPTDHEVELLERWRAGDQQALDQLLSEIFPWLHREMSHALPRESRAVQDSMDLAQTAVMNFLRGGARFVPTTPAQFRALLKRIASNELIDQWRRQKRAGGGRHLESMVHSGNPLSGFLGPHGSTAPDRQAERSEEIEWVKLALQFLGEQDRWLLLASEVEGLDWATVAEELGMSSPDAARMRAIRIRPRLANLMRQLRSGSMPAAS